MRTQRHCFAGINSSAAILNCLIVLFHACPLFAQGSWQTSLALPTVQTIGQMSVIDRKLYVVGGGTLSGPTNSLFVYDPDENTWDQSKSPSPTLRQGGAAVTVDGLLYLVGGCNNGDGNYPTNRLDVYDPNTDEWTNLTPMPTSRCKISAAVIDGKIYVVGGFSSGYSNFSITGLRAGAQLLAPVVAELNELRGR